MADLDDFFAKKDRKKSKGGKKFTTTEELAKKLEETHRKEKEKLKEQKTLTNQTQTMDNDGKLGGERRDEDEWKDFEEEKKDYTNLKIQNLQISDTPTADDGDGDGDENEMEENEAGEMVPRKKQPSGPWSHVSQPHQQEEPVRETRPQQQPPPSSDGGGGGGGGGGGAGGYVPPHLRGAPSHYSPSSSSYSSSSYSSSSYSSSMHHQPVSTSRFRSKAAPDLTNEAFFPTLSAANNAEPASAWGRRREDGRGFEEVRNSRTHTATYNPKMASSGQGPNLSLGNQWDALRDQS